MNRIAAFIALAFVAIGAQAQTSIFLETFNGGAADWADVDYAAVTHNASGGHNGGAYITASIDIDTSSGGAQGLGGYTAARCSVAPSQNPALNCSSGNFVGDWWFVDGVQTLRMWFRHNSTKPGGIIPQIRVATPGNTPGGSAIFPAVAANTWTLLTVPLDPTDPLWDQTWGAVTPDAVKIFRNIGRVQLGYFVDPNDPTYTENNVSFDVDDVEILGSTSLTAVIRHKGLALHPHHDGTQYAVGNCSGTQCLDDDVRARVLGASTSVGDPVDINTSNILNSTVRIGPLGGASHTALYGVNEDNDGIADAEFIGVTSGVTGDTRVTNEFIGAENEAARCLPPPFDWQNPTLALRAELTTGEIIAGEDLTVNVNCDAVCH